MPFPEESDALLSTEEWIRITRYVADECEARDVTEIEQWLSADPSRTELAEDLEEIWSLLGDADPVAPTTPDDSRTSALWKRIAGSMNWQNGQDDRAHSRRNELDADGGE